MSAAVAALEQLAIEVGEHLIRPLVEALVAGDAKKAERAARIVAETRAAKLAIRAARGKAR